MDAILIIGVLAILAGALAVWPFFRRRGRLPSPSGSAGPVADLRQELEARYQGLAELDEDLAAGKLSAEDHARLKAELERGAAVLLSRLEATEHTPTPKRRRLAQAPPPEIAESGWERFFRRPTVLAGGAVLFLLVGLGLGLVLPRLLNGPPPPPAGSPSSDQLVQLEREAQANPTDVKKLLAFGHLALDEGQPSKAIWAYKQVLALDPNNVEAITHTGLLLFQGGHVDQALSHLDKALTLDPTSIHALWDKAQILYSAKQDYSGAIKAWEAFLAQVPSGADADRARAMIAEAKGRALRANPTGSRASN